MYDDKHAKLRSEHMEWVHTMIQIGLAETAVKTKLKMDFKLTLIDPFDDVVHGWQLNSLQWRHNQRDRVSNDQPRDCLLNRLFKVHIKNIMDPRHWPLWGEITDDRWIPRTKGQ